MENTQVLERENTAETNKLEFVEKPVYDFFKRVFDVVCSLIASIILLIPMMIIAMLIVMKDAGSPFYKHYRVGKNNSSGNGKTWNNSYTSQNYTPDQVVDVITIS